MDKGKLYLIPTTISSGTEKKTLAETVQIYIRKIDIFIVENIRKSRRYILKIDQNKDINNTVFYENNKHSSINLQKNLLENILAGKNIGLLSDSGLPCIADPGNKIVEYAHQFNIDVIPITGPSSILLALIASGMSGQEFTFNGYLPIKNKERKKKIKHIETLANKNQQTQIFIETPYRNNQLLNAILENCNKNTRLCLAIDVTGEREHIKTKTIQEWRKIKYTIPKEPCVFLIY